MSAPLAVRACIAGIITALLIAAPAAAGPGADAAARHVRFARTLAASHLRMSGDLDRVTSEIEEHDCKVTTAAALLPADQQDIAMAIASDYCRPWEKFWDRLSRSCDADKPPQWCGDEAAALEHLDLDGYFSALASALRTSDADLVRENIMDVVLAAFSAHVIGDFGNEPPNRWATETVDAYVTTASFDQVVALARRLRETWVGLTPGVVDRLREYSRRHEGLTAEQQDQIESFLTERFLKQPPQPKR